jgi:hypothetical protein
MDLATHIVIPDTQVKPGVPLDHLSWIGEYICEFAGRENVSVIHLGDHGDMPSLSLYDQGKKEMEGRRYREDIAAANYGWKVLNTPLNEYNLVRKRYKERQWHPNKYFLLGNHEDRINRAISGDAKLDGTIGTDDLDYARTGWDVYGFREVLWLDGVAYSHYFYNPMTGKPYGGASIDTRLKNVGHSFTMGHQQTLMYGLRFVGGRSQHGLVAGACYLHDEDYKGPQGNAHWRGIIIKHQVENGSYDPMFVSLDYLCRRYEGKRLENYKPRIFAPSLKD